MTARRVVTIVSALVLLAAGPPVEASVGQAPVAGDPGGSASAPPPGWENITRHTRPTRLLDASMAYDSQHDRVVLFGGSQVPRSEGTTWVLDGRRWSELAAGTSPSSRRDAPAAFDEARGEVVMFGGRPGRGGAGLRDTWVLQGDQWTRRDPAVSPPGDSSGRLVYDPLREQTVLFGGRLLDDRTWVWDGASWERVRSAVSPPPRYDHGMAFDAARGVVVLFGGRTDDVVLDDTWAWDGSSWTQLSDVGSPGERVSMGMAAFGDEVVVSGGYDAGSIRSAETWVLGSDGWQVLPVRRLPGRLAQHALVFDPVRDRAVLYGGTKTRRSSGAYKIQERTLVLHR